MSDSENIVEIARKLYERDSSCWNEIYEKARADLYFLSDEPGAQWDDRGFRARVDEGRPALTVDQLSQFVHQVANEMRKNTPAITAIPVEDSDEEQADAVKEWMRGIEYRSNADDVYDNASLFAIRCSIGFIRIDHDYIDGKGFEQELTIKRVVNPFSVFIDSDSIECDGRDAKHGFVLEKMHISEFEREYPDFTPVSFDADKTDRPQKEGDVVVCEFFRIKKKYEEIANDDGRKRKVEKCTVERYKLSGTDVLQKTTFPGKYIPIVPVYGEEQWIDGKRYILSLIRRAKDGQMMFNLWKSLEAELLMQQPRAPIMVAEGQITGYEEGYLNPGSKAVLTYRQTDVDGNQAPRPDRLQQPQIPTGIVNAARGSVDDIKSTMGLYDASLGQRSNETSGIAIARRQAEGQNATYHIQDNLTRSITQVARILESARPEIYDTERMVPGIDAEDKPKMIGINGALGPNQKRSYDFTKGRHEIRVTTSTSFATKREESAAFLTDLVNKQPQMMQVMGDLLFKYMDVAGAEAMAERMKKVIPANLTTDDDEQDPEKMQLVQAIQEMQAQLQQAQAALQSKDGEAQLKVAEMQAKAQIEQAKIQGSQDEASLDAQIRMQELALREREIAQKEADTQLQRAIAIEEMRLRALELELAAMQKPKEETEEPEMGNSQDMAMQMAILQTISEVRASIDGLANQIAQPKNVVYENGMIVGVQ